MEKIRWSETPVGQRSGWSSALQTMVRVVLGSRFSMWMAWGADLTFFCNDAYARDTLGVKYPWALGRPASEVWAEIWHDIGPRIDHVLATGEATWDQDLLLFLERSGYREETYHTFSYSPLFDGDSVVGMLCVVSEETERVIGERRMRTLRELGADLAGSMTEQDMGVSLTRRLGSNLADLPFTATFVADGGVPRLLAATGDAELSASMHTPVTDATAWSVEGVRPGELRVVSDLDLQHGQLPTGDWDDPPNTAIVVGLGEAGQSEPTGYLVAGLNPYRSLDSAYSGFVGLVGRQIEAALSNVRAFEAERRRAEALAELDRAKTAFFTNISHEFRTPLTLMLGPLEDVLSSPPELHIEHRERLDVVRRNGLRMLKLVNALLEFARIEGGHVSASLEPVEIGSLTAEIAGMFRSAIEDAGLVLVVDCANLSPVLVDPHMWELIVTNLLSNAFKYTFKGSITVTLDGDDNDVRLVVTDTGTGIPAHELPLLFGRFHRVEGAASRSHEGSGVGLSLVHELVSLHDGSIRVDSEVDIGTTFTVAIPALASSDGADAIRELSPSRTLSAHVSEVRQWTTEPAASKATTEQRPRTVLVVDDNVDMRSYLDRLLTDQYRVATAVHGADALEQLDAGLRAELIVADVMMPIMDGLELIRRLRDDARFAEIPVILLSARAGTEASVEGLELGADDYLVKPFSASDLLARVSARIAAGVERRRSRIVGELADVLQSAQNALQIAQACNACVQELTAHDQFMLAVTNEDRVDLTFVPQLHAGLSHRYGTIASDAHNPFADTINTGAVTVSETRAGFDALYPHLAADHANAGLAAIVVSPAYDSVGQCLGALGFAWANDRPVDPDTLADIAAVCAVAGRALERLAFIAHERRVATAIQQQLLDVRPRADVAAFAARYRPADQSMIVGGDWYDAFDVGPHALGIVVGDVVGSGLPAAIVMGQLRSSLGTTGTVATGPAAAIAMVDEFAQRIPGALATTAVFATITRNDTHGSTLTWCAAGHPPPVIADERGASLLWKGRRTPLGVAAQTSATQATEQLGPCTVVVLYSDGLIERRDEPLDVSLERLRQAVEQHRHLPVHLLHDHLIASLANGPATDDLVVVATRTAGATATNFVDIVPAQPYAVTVTRQRLRDWLNASTALTVEAQEDLLLAVGEAVANAVEHGAKTPSEVITVEVACDGPAIVATISDTGTWSPDSANSIHRSRGRGLAIMEHFAQVRTHRSPLGTTVILEFDPTQRPLGV
jgi:signal transduction histidine kinase/DNA-binding response OmpR family regulator